MGVWWKRYGYADMLLGREFYIRHRVISLPATASLSRTLMVPRCARHVRERSQRGCTLGDTRRRLSAQQALLDDACLKVGRRQVKEPVGAQLLEERLRNRRR